MAFQITRIPDEPIMIVHFLNPFDVAKDIAAIQEEVKLIYDAADQPLWDITIATDLHLSFGQMVEGLALITRGHSNVIKHPMAAGWIVVVNQSLIRLGAEALTQAQYGALRLLVAENYEEALVKARAQIRQRSQAA
jgi:hypothetical protein